MNTLGTSGRTLAVSEGGTGASTPDAARKNLSVPLSTDTPSLSAAANELAGDLTVDGQVHVGGAVWVGGVSGSNLNIDKTHGALTFYDPANPASKIIGITANPTGFAVINVPTLSGTLLPYNGTPVKGTLAWFDGSAWQSLAPGVGTLHCDAAGNLTWA